MSCDVILSRVFIAALWSHARKGMTSWLLFVMFIVFLSLSHSLSQVRCGTCTKFYRFSIFSFSFYYIYSRDGAQIDKCTDLDINTIIFLFLQVYCDQLTDGGGWIVFQRRQDGTVDFYRDWAEYKQGFGSLDGEFWLGNEKLHRLLSSSKRFELRVDLGDFEGNLAYAKYNSFKIGPESDVYRLEVSGYSGNAGTSLEYHNGQPFITKDRDRYKCSTRFKGGWWYGSCGYANLNGLYNSTKTNARVIWLHWKGRHYSLRFVEMKFREIN